MKKLANLYALFPPTYDLVSGNAFTYIALNKHTRSEMVDYFSSVTEEPRLWWRRGKIIVPLDVREKYENLAVSSKWMPHVTPPLETDDPVTIKAFAKHFQDKSGKTCMQDVIVANYTEFLYYIAIPLMNTHARHGAFNTTMDRISMMVAIMDETPIQMSDLENPYIVELKKLVMDNDSHFYMENVMTDKRLFHIAIRIVAWRYVQRYVPVQWRSKVTVQAMFERLCLDGKFVQNKREAFRALMDEFHANDMMLHVFSVVGSVIAGFLIEKHRRCVVQLFGMQSLYLKGFCMTGIEFMNALQSFLVRCYQIHNYETETIVTREWMDFMRRRVVDNPNVMRDIDVVTICSHVAFYRRDVPIYNPETQMWNAMYLAKMTPVVCNCPVNMYTERAVHEQIVRVMETVDPELMNQVKNNTFMGLYWEVGYAFLLRRLASVHGVSFGDVWQQFQTILIRSEVSNICKRGAKRGRMVSRKVTEPYLAFKAVVKTYDVRLRGETYRNLKILHQDCNNFVKKGQLSLMFT